MKYIAICFFVVIIAATFVGAPNAIAGTQQFAGASLQQNIDTRPPRLWGVTGPTTLPAGEAGGWNQDNQHRPSQYTHFSLDNLRWTWGDGSKPSSDNIPENFHAYKKPGTYKAKLEGLDAQGRVVDTVRFTVKVTKAKKYSLKITKLDTKKDYKIGSKIPVAYTIKNAPNGNVAAWVGFRLINQKTGEKFFLTDAWDARGSSGELELPGVHSYSQDGPLTPGKYRLETYMYGVGSSNFPSVKSRPFTILPE